MRRRTFDALLTVAGLVLTVVLVMAGGMLAWASNFVDDQVTTQLSAQRIFFPEKGTESLEDPAVKPYLEQSAGPPLPTGAQAKAYADHYIKVHLDAMGGGQTYAELSATSRANPDDADAAALVETTFRGETLRGLLLNAYAFGTMGTIALYGAIASFVGAGVLLLLSLLGVAHLRRVPVEAEVRLGARRVATA
jgi:hypothetical protein